MSEPTCTPQCPVCGAAQAESLLCHADTVRLEQALGDVRSVVEDLDIALSKQARIGTPGKGGLARERNPIHEGARLAGDYLGNVLTTWARDVAPLYLTGLAVQLAAIGPTQVASTVLLNNVDAVRRHPDVATLLDEITDAVEQARRAVDRPADKAYLGRCTSQFTDEYDEAVTCFAELWIRPEATECACRVCGHEYEVMARRQWLIEQAAEMVVTAKEASVYLADVGALNVSEASIRNWVARRKVLLRPGLSTQRQFELGALMDHIAGRDADARKDALAELPMAV